jgi:RNA polymerase sigma factor (sigma-70 family)
MADPVGGPGPRTSDAAADSGATTTLRLLARAREGDAGALSEVFARTGPALRRWARGRLPQWARDVADTDDLVQDALISTLKQLDVFEYRTDGALQAYLRQAVMNRLRDELRRKGRAPVHVAHEGLEFEAEGSPLEEAMGREAFERYQAALTRLRPEEREAIIARVEMDYSYAELAEILGKPTPDAARKAAQRALVRLAEEMKT